jgi:two-component system response regulator PhoP
MRLLIVEDEDLLRAQLVKALTDAGYVADSASDGERGLFQVKEFEYDATIIDLGLPKLNGIELIKTIRGEGMTFPILILTARDNWTDKVEALDSGADDYVVKPFQIEEIKARLNALLRRAAGFAKPTLDFAGLSLNTTVKRMQVNGSEVELTAYEYKVLEYLMLHPGKVVSKTELTEHLYDQDYDRDSNVLEVFIRRLRQKLDPEETLKPIDTIRGQGYRFNVPANNA